jgi:OmpA-OmpF porin, OOP family
MAKARAITLGANPMNPLTAWMNRLLLTLWALGTALPALALDEAPGQHHPLVSRFGESRLVGYLQTHGEQARVPTRAALKNGRWSEVQPVAYTSARGKSHLKVHRNDEQALLATGLTKQASCEQRCKPVRVSLDTVLSNRSGMQFARDAIPHPVSGTFMITSAFSDEQVRWFYGTPQRGGAEWHVRVATSQTVKASTDMATAFIQIVEPKPMQTDGKSALKPESQGQLHETTALLERQAALKVFIVGHTDHVGVFEANRALSLAPMAPNGHEGGRARDRRVELVLQ